MNTVSPKLAEQWKALRSEISSARNGKLPLAGLFLGHIPDGYEKQSKRVLFVGKATAGEFNEEDASSLSFNGKSSFWQFARQVSRCAGGKSVEPVNVAWSNVSKIGVAKGNPSKSLQLAQAALACKTLQDEIETCKPTLVVFVCDGYGDEIIYEAVNANRGGANDFEIRHSSHGEFYVRKAIQIGSKQYPAMLWVKHPQGKSSERRVQWIEEAKKLLV